MATTTTVTCDKCGQPIGAADAQVILTSLVNSQGAAAPDGTRSLTSYSGGAHLHELCAADVAAMLGTVGIKAPTPAN